MIKSNLLDLTIEILENDKKFYKVVKDKLKELNQNNYYPLSNLWKGSNFYSKLLFGFPLILEKNNIDKYHYFYRQMIYFDDIIQGHPMATNGWYNESFNDYLKLLENKY